MWITTGENNTAGFYRDAFRQLAGTSRTRYKDIIDWTKCVNKCTEVPPPPPTQPVEMLLPSTHL